MLGGVEMPSTPESLPQKRVVSGKSLLVMSLLT